MRWVGIDEAGYGPNLGPLAMTAVVAEGGDASRPPDVWADLAATVARAGSRDDRLCVDDSKVVYRGRRGLDRLAEATDAAIEAAGHPRPETLGDLFRYAGAGSLAEVELAPWLPSPDPAIDGGPPRRPGRLAGAPWRVVGVVGEVVGPRRFNAELARSGLKSDVHAAAFGRLIRPIWEAGGSAFIRGDKHGGRNFYAPMLRDHLPDAAITPLEEGPGRSLYEATGPDARMIFEFRPRADAVDGLVALASIVGKYLRETWMDSFNAFWATYVPGLRPTAGYPVDAARFRSAIESAAARLGLGEDDWWRRK